MPLPVWLKYFLKYTSNGHFLLAKARGGAGSFLCTRRVHHGPYFLSRSRPEKNHFWLWLNVQVVVALRFLVVSFGSVDSLAALSWPGSTEGERSPNGHEGTDHDYTS